MKKSVVIGAVACVAVFVGVVYFMREPRTPPDKGGGAARAPTGAAPKAQASPPAIVKPAVSRTPPPPGPRPSDPRLAAMMPSPDNGLIEFVTGPDGHVYKEIDNDPGSLGYRKPSREYIYSGGRVTGLIAYHYLGDQVQITRTAVSYKPDGSVDQYQESTRYESAKKKGGGG